jgi:hypothetical protein
MKPSAYISDGGILFKESPPDSMIKLTPLYAMRELTNDEIKEVYGQYFDVKNCDWLHLECIKAILKKASEK